MSKKKNVLPIRVKLLINRLYSKYGYWDCFYLISHMKSPTPEQKKLYLDYLTKIKERRNN